MWCGLTQSSAEWLSLRRELAAGRLEGTQDMPVAIVLEDGTPYEQPGKLAFSEVSVDPTTGSFALRVVVPNPEHILLPGMWGRILSIIIMLVGVTLFVRLGQTLLRPHKVRYPCERCGLQVHDPDAVHCKACGNLLCIPDEGAL